MTIRVAMPAPSKKTSVINKLNHRDGTLSVSAQIKADEDPPIAPTGAAVFSRVAKRRRREPRWLKQFEHYAASERGDATPSPSAAPSDPPPESAEQSNPRRLRKGDLVRVSSEW